jgi:hypothetical protein
LEEELAAHGFQHPLVETENIGEPAVRDAPVTLEHRPHLGEQRMDPALDLCRMVCVGIGGCGLPRPDQDAAILIHRQALTLNKLVFECCQVLGIELKLQLEGPIRQAAALA